MEPMPLFKRPDRHVVDSYQQATGTKPRVIGWGSGRRVELLAFADSFAVHFGDEPWRRIGWHEVRSGGWRTEGEIHWRLVDGSRESFQLTDEANFPEVFRDRVQASIALDEVYELPRGGALQVSARRDLAQSTPTLLWHTVAIRGARLDDPQTRAEAAALEARLRADYDL